MNLKEAREIKARYSSSDTPLHDKIGRLWDKNISASSFLEGYEAGVRGCIGFLENTVCSCLGAGSVGYQNCHFHQGIKKLLDEGK